MQSLESIGSYVELSALEGSMEPLDNQIHIREWSPERKLAVRVTIKKPTVPNTAWSCISVSGTQLSYNRVPALCHLTPEKEFSEAFNHTSVALSLFSDTCLDRWHRALSLGSCVMLLHCRSAIVSYGLAFCTQSWLCLGTGKIVPRFITSITVGVW